MKVLIFEYITGGGMVDAVLPHSLVQEGDMMLASAASDFAELPDVHVSVLRDYRLSIDKEIVESIIINPQDSCVKKIKNLTEQFDALLVIAPETDGILYSLCNEFSHCGFLLLNSTSFALQITGNKYSTYRYFKEHGIPQIPTYRLHELNDLCTDKYVLKPVDGVGCEGLRLFSNISMLEKELLSCGGNSLIAQPFINGKHVSLSLMCWNGECILLCANEQNIVEQEGNLKLLGCKTNALDNAEFNTLSKKIIKAIPGLRGYIGIDVLVTNEQILLVEINPRLTTSYVGIKSALGFNPAAMMLHCFIHKQLPKFAPMRNDKITVDIGTSCAA